MNSRKKRPLRLMGAAVALLTAAPALAKAQLGVKPVLDATVVEENAVTFSFPLPYAPVKPPNPPIAGFYAWRITTVGDSAISMVLASDSPVRSNNLDQVIRTSTLRLCPSTESQILQCVQVVRGQGKAKANGIEMTLRDTSVINRLRRLGHRTYWRYAFEPGGHFHIEKLSFAYR